MRLIAGVVLKSKTLVDARLETQVQLLVPVPPLAVVGQYTK